MSVILDHGGRKAKGMKVCFLELTVSAFLRVAALDKRDEAFSFVALWRK